MIGNTLKRLREIYGYKAGEMSKLLTISSSYLSEIENNHKKPSLDLLNRYSEIYGIKLSSLVAIMENYESAKKQNKGQAQITKMMIGLIEKMSADTEVDNGQTI